MEAATSMMERVTPNVYTNTRLRGCNPSFVATSGSVGSISPWPRNRFGWAFRQWMR